MQFIDIHTHRRPHPGETAIQNSIPPHDTGGFISVGIHPWNITEGYEVSLEEAREAARADNVVMIGECGIDKLKSPAPLPVQIALFRAQADLAEELHKPLIIHCVKAFDSIVALHKEIHPSQPWIIHGFRGKQQLAQQLIRAGLYISLGEHFNKESALLIPAERLFIESDESIKSIEEIYRAVAEVRGCQVEELVETTTANARECGIMF